MSRLCMEFISQLKSKCLSDVVFAEFKYNHVHHICNTSSCDVPLTHFWVQTRGCIYSCKAVIELPLAQ